MEKKLSVLVHVYNLNTWEKERDDGESEANQVTELNSRSVWTI